MTLKNLENANQFVAVLQFTGSFLYYHKILDTFVIIFVFIFICQYNLLDIIKISKLRAIKCMLAVSKKDKSVKKR